MPSSAFTPCGLVALLTDFGLSDPYVGVMHGVIARHAPAVRVIDLTHGVPPQDLRAAAFFLEHGRAHFPAGTVFVAVVDPGVGSSRRILALREGSALALAPDNGLLGSLSAGALEVRSVDLARFVPPGASRTFHGRDVFAPLAARLASGELAFEELGPVVRDAVVLEGLPLERGARRVQGSVLLADRFGNLITNLRPADLEGDPRAWRARAGGRELAWVATYAEARHGAPSILVNSYGFLEIAVAGGSAARSLALATGGTIELER